VGRLKTFDRRAPRLAAISLRSILLFCLVLRAGAAQADSRGYFALSYDPREKSSLAIANLKSLRGPRVVPPLLLQFQGDHDVKPRFEFSGKRLRFRLPF
jgi:hypothetical protein